MAISRSQLVKELEPGLNALFGLEYKQYANEHAEIPDQRDQSVGGCDVVVIINKASALFN